MEEERSRVWWTQAGEATCRERRKWGQERGRKRERTTNLALLLAPDGSQVLQDVVGRERKCGAAGERTTDA